MRAPILRFKEFTDDWEGTTLENLAEVERGKFSVRPRNDPRYFGGEMPFVQTGDVAGSDMYLKGYSQTLNADGIKVSRVFPADTILITIAANIGDTTITQYAVACPDSVVAIQAKKDLANTIFLKNLIDLQKENLDSQATQNAQKNINLQVLKPLQLIAPSKAEQTKIATFLSAVDEKISQLSQKLHLLGQYKQGMMQKLFSQQIRFKADDGSEFGEWESKKLNEIGQSFNGLVGKSKEDFGEGEAYITYKQIFDHRKINLNNINFVNISPNDTQNMVKKGDIFFTTSSETANEVAYCSVILDDFEFPLYLNSFCFGYRPNSAKIFNSAYASFYFRSNIFRNKIKHLAQGSTRFNISKIAFMNVLIHLPMLEEQTKIANFLSTIDQKIDVVSEQLKQAKIWKKGLLQQMFV